MDALLTQLSMHHAELALRMVVSVVLGGAITGAAGAGMYVVSALIATLAFTLPYTLRKTPRQRLSDRQQPAEDGARTPKESES